MKQNGDPKIAIVGGGIGGTTVALFLKKYGFSPRVFEQAPRLDRIGAGINLGPNAVRVLQEVGLAEKMIEVGVCPSRWVSRAHDSGAILNDMPLGETAAERYGAPYLLMHRGDMQSILADAIGEDMVQGKRLIDLQQDDRCVTLTFADGSVEEADFVIGADGLNSRVREILVGPEAPLYTGHIAHRAIIPGHLVRHLDLDDLSKWWGPDRHLLVYFIESSRSEVYVVTGTPQPEWPAGVSFMDADLGEMRAAFADFHPTIRELFDLCPYASKWPLYARKPMQLWSSDRVVLLGDACHPMKPHMGAGAAMAMEDAAVLARSLEAAGGSGFQHAFRLYEANRMARATKVQTVSNGNAWLREPTDTDWVYGYDAVREPLVASLHNVDDTLETSGQVG